MREGDEAEEGGGDIGCKRHSQFCLNDHKNT
jgi:hypothetical protein